MIRRILIVVMIMLTTIGSAQLCLANTSFVAPCQTEVLTEGDAVSGTDNRDISHVNDAEHWTRRSTVDAWPDAWELADVSYYPNLPIHLEGRALDPIYRPPIDGGTLSHPNPIARAA
ncbi:hypothetical protein [Rhizobium sp.]|uniref:hypothetical protein n=2 Tax=unclassified Rhizobium TaxID=2613769 RepID=UPI001618DF94